MQDPVTSAAKSLEDEGNLLAFPSLPLCYTVKDVSPVRNIFLRTCREKGEENKVREDGGGTDSCSFL